MSLEDPSRSAIEVPEDPQDPGVERPAQGEASAAPATTTTTTTTDTPPHDMAEALGMAGFSQAHEPIAPFSSMSAQLHKVVLKRHHSGISVGSIASTISHGAREAIELVQHSLAEDVFGVGPTDGAEPDSVTPSGARDALGRAVYARTREYEQQRLVETWMIAKLASAVDVGPNTVRRIIEAFLHESAVMTCIQRGFKFGDYFKTKLVVKAAKPERTVMKNGVAKKLKAKPQRCRMRIIMLDSMESLSNVQLDREQTAQTTGHPTPPPTPWSFSAHPMARAVMAAMQEDEGVSSSPLAMRRPVPLTPNADDEETNSVDESADE